MHVTALCWLCCLVVYCAAGCLQSIAPEVLVPRLHPRDPARTAVTFVALGDSGRRRLAQTQVAHAMASVCQRDGCDFVLASGIISIPIPSSRCTIPPSRIN